MIKISVCILFLMAGVLNNTQAQATYLDTISCSTVFDTLTNRTVYKTATHYASVEGGQEKLLSELRLKLKYPHIEGNTIQTIIMVAFVVDTNSQLIGKRIIRNIDGTNLAQQVLTIVDNFKWIPATCNSKAVPMYLQFPVRIELK